MNFVTTIQLAVASYCIASSQTLNKEEGFKGNDETFLLEHLMTNYRGYGLARPVLDVEKPMDVNFRLSLEQFVGLDEQNGVARIAATADAHWQDEFLRWNYSTWNYSHIEALLLQDQKVFIPLIVPGGSHNGDKPPIFHKYLDKDSSNAILWTDKSGHVQATATDTFETYCKINFQDFPFDTQLCRFNFKALRFRQPRIRLQLFEKSACATDGHEFNKNEDEEDANEMSNRRTNPLWKVVSVEGNVVTVQSNGISNAIIVYTVIIKRQSAFYIWNFLLPIVSLSTIQLSTFFLPIGLERVMFSITSVLAIDIFQSSLKSRFQTDWEPLPVAKYSAAQLIIGIFITVQSVFMLDFVKKARRPLPRWLVKLLLFPKCQPKPHRQSSSCFPDDWKFVAIKAKPESLRKTVVGVDKLDNLEDLADLEKAPTKCHAQSKRRQKLDLTAERQRCAESIDKLFLFVNAFLALCLPIAFFWGFA